VPGPFVVFTVADTGVGIPSDKIEAIFEPFYTTKPVGHGTGLGLATVRDLVRSHGGFVSVTSEPGRGARFCVHWPAAQPDGARAIAAPEGHGECVLIADGDRSAAELARVALETYGYRAAVAHDAAEAAALFATHRDVIRVAVIDRAGPLEPAAVRASAPGARLVGLGSGDDCDVALEKPYTATDLLRAVAAALHSEGRAP
jgi:hypothetical protein